MTYNTQISPTSKSVTKSTWNISRSSPTPLRLQKYSKDPAVPEIQELVQKLAQLEGVGRVTAIAPKATDLHWINFDVVLNPHRELYDEFYDDLWDKVQDLVIDCEWALRDKTGENWYFYGEVIDNLQSMAEGARIVAASYLKPSETIQKSRSISSQLKLQCS